MVGRKPHIRQQVWGLGWLGPARPESEKRGCPGLRQKLTWGFPHSPPEGAFLSLLVYAWSASNPHRSVWV